MAALALTRGPLGTVHQQAPRRRHHGHPSGVHAPPATISLSTQELQNPNYTLSYICSWTGSQWKCGCRVVHVRRVIGIFSRLNGSRAIAVSAVVLPAGRLGGGGEYTEL
jgi:hypothetical protein